MALINRFADPVEEEQYIRTERSNRLPAMRALIVISLGIFIGFSLFNPIFFPANSLVIYNIVSMTMIISLIIALFFIRTDYYLKWRWLDPLMFSLLAIASIILMRALASTEDTTGTSFLGMAIINLAVIFVFGSICFVANVRWFFIWTAALMASYLIFLAIQPIPIFPKVYMVANVSMFLSFALFVCWSLDERARSVFAANRALAAEQAKTEELLYNVLPQAVATRLRAGEAVADSFSDVSVIFVDIVGFSRLAKQLSPGHLVEQLNHFFSIADTCAERYGVEKVKTIGDAYLAVSGGTASSGHGARDAINFSRELIAEMQQRAEVSGVDIKLRIGIHSGPVVGGVVGSSRLAYDYWGDTMNIASRIEGTAEPNGIAVSAATYFQCGDSHEFSAAESLTLKGVGDTEIYRVKL